MGFSKRTSYPSKDNKYFFSGLNPFYGTRYGPPAVSHNCTWYAWGRFSEVRGKKATGLGTGNAGTWYSSTKNFSKGKTPKLGAVVVYYYTSGAGHVAVVEEIKSNGDIVTSNSGWSGANFWMETCKKSNGYKPSWLRGGLHGFIYNDKITGGGGGADHPKSWYTKKYGNEAKVYFALRDEGLSHKAACAIMGNMKQESGFSPTVVNSLGATGLCQWLRDRCTRMKKFNSGHAWNTIAHQVKFLMSELKGGYKAKVYNVLKNDKKSLRDMTYAFLRHYEIPGNYDTEINRRYPNSQTYDKRYANAYGDGEGGEYGEDVQAVVNMQQRSSQLYSSNNYKYLTEQAAQEETEEQKKFKAQVAANKEFLRNIKVKNLRSGEGSVPDTIKIKTGRSSGRLIKTANSIAPISEAMVEAPFVELDFNGKKIGTFRNSVDEFPNHISGLQIEKTNGEINKYTFNLVHQIRPGEDPNLIDKLLSRVRYDRIGIRYGDFNSNVIYGDEKAIITNVAMNRDYVSNRISYTIYATSANELITSHKLNFLGTVDKPSNVIRSLLYDNRETSNLLLSAFPGMKNKTLVDSHNLIPNNDIVLDIDEKLNINAIQYLNYLTSCMSNKSNNSKDVIRNSTYYACYENDFNNIMGGAFFAIKELTTNVLNKFNSSNVFEVTVGYPDNNYVMGFSVENDLAWSLLYDKATVSDEYVYDIDNRGYETKDFSPNLVSSSSILNETQKNWWTQMTHFPINASLTLKGFMKPVMLMDYIIVNVVFYGQKHITSGVYTITGQQDTLSGEGFRTTLALTRVGAN